MGHVSAWLESLGELEPVLHGTRWYERAARVAPGALIAWRPRGGGALGREREVLLDVAQSGLDQLGWAGSLILLGNVMAEAGHVTRLDAWLDDHARHAEPEEVRAAFKAGKCRTHARASTFFNNDVTGSTTYIGTRKSAQLLRVYDKEGESGVLGAGVRWELETHDDKAVEFARALSVAADGRAVVIGALRGYIDFHNVKDGERPSRAPLLPWWNAIVGDTARITLAEPGSIDSLARRAAWLERQAAPSLALLQAARGQAYIEYLIELGRRQLAESQLRLPQPVPR